MSFNLVVLEGSLAADPEHRTFESGTSLLRCLVTVRSHAPRRVDVIPVIVWEPDADVLDAICEKGQDVWLAGSVQRRFWADADGRESKVEVIARAIGLRPQMPDGGDPTAPQH